MFVLQLFNAVPAPNVFLIHPPSGQGDDVRVYPGSAVMLQCDATVSSLVDTSVSVQFTWKDASNTVTSGGNVWISEVSLVSETNSTYQSTIIISDLRADTLYTCYAKIHASSSTQNHVLPSNVAMSSPVYVDISGMYLSVYV